MPNCYFLIGPPACGKSTWVLNDGPKDALIISSDDLIEAEARERGLSYHEVFPEICFTDMDKRLRVRTLCGVMDNRDIVIDRTNMTIGDRMKFRRLLPATYKRIGVVFEYDRDALLARTLERERRTGKRVPHYVIDRLIGDYQAPLPGEMDQLITVPVRP